MKKNFFDVVVSAMVFFIAISCSNKTSTPKTDSESEFPDYPEVELEDEFFDDSLSDDSSDEVSDTESDEKDFIDEDFVDDDIIIETPIYRSGFIELKPANYIFNGSNYSAGKVRMWYNFQPADENPEDKPLFVFFNGGPGSSSTILFAYNTSKMTGDQAYSKEGVVENLYSWTTMGNLLYIDARQTGFSYGMIDNPENDAARSNEYSPSAFNVFIDASDFIKVVLRILSQTPAIRANQVVLVGQSYGGTRVTAMLNILFNIRDYADGNRSYYEKALFDEINAHYLKIYPEMSKPPDKELVKKQFSHQVLIQPLVAGYDQFNESGKILEQAPGPMYEIEAETGIKFNPCNPANPSCRPHNNALDYVRKADRDIYRYREKYNWLFDYVAVAGEKITDIKTMEQLMKNDPLDIDRMYAENREKAFRHPGINMLWQSFNYNIDAKHIPDSVRTEIDYNEQYYKTLISGNLEEFFGELEVYDDYYISLNSLVTRQFYYFDFSPYSKENGDMFLENIKDVETFITNAEEDIVIYSPGIPPSLLKYDIVESVVEANEKFTVKFKDGKEIGITFPYYPASSHSVSINQPEKFYEDVKDWLEGE
jgi:hypothetical protein